MATKSEIKKILLLAPNTKAWEQSRIRSAWIAQMLRKHKITADVFVASNGHAIVKTGGYIIDTAINDFEYVFHKEVYFKRFENKICFEHAYKKVLPNDMILKR
jgi:hypothetical protein